MNSSTREAEDQPPEHKKRPPRRSTPPDAEIQGKFKFDYKKGIPKYKEEHRGILFRGYSSGIPWVFRGYSWQKETEPSWQKPRNQVTTSCACAASNDAQKTRTQLRARRGWVARCITQTGAGGQGEKQTSTRQTAGRGNKRVRHEVGLELGDVDVERAVEAERGGERRDDLRHEAVEVGVRRALDVEVAAADVVERLVIHAERDVRVLEQRVGREHRVVRLDGGVRDLRRRRDSERELRLAAVDDREALEEERAEARGSRPRR